MFVNTAPGVQGFCRGPVSELKTKNSSFGFHSVSRIINKDNKLNLLGCRYLDNITRYDSV